MKSIAYNMDCVQGMKTLADESIDLTVTSPPYDNLRDYNGYTFDWKATIAELARITKLGGVVVWIVNDATIDGSETGTSFKQALYAMECGFNLHDTMIWEKHSPAHPEQNRYGQCFEYMFVWSKGSPKSINLIADKPNVSAGKKITGTYREQNGELKSKVSSGRSVTYNEFGTRYNVWNVVPYSSTVWHPAVFPYKLAFDHIRSWSNEGDTVLDPFLGSGTTRRAAYDLNRNFIGFEISKEYYDAEEAEFEAYLSQMSLFD